MNFEFKFANELTAAQMHDILKARAEVFIMEQNIHYCDPDEIDLSALHCFLHENGQIVGYLRAFYTDAGKKTVKIGRVLTRERGKGFGRVLMELSLRAISQKMPCEFLTMHAQIQVVDFYKKFGFAVTSTEFLEEGVRHVEMGRIFVNL